MCGKNLQNCNCIRHWPRLPRQPRLYRLNARWLRTWRGWLESMVQENSHFHRAAHEQRGAKTTSKNPNNEKELQCHQSPHQPCQILNLRSLNPVPQHFSYEKHFLKKYLKQQIRQHQHQPNPNGSSSERTDFLPILDSFLLRKLPQTDRLL